MLKKQRKGDVKNNHIEVNPDVFEPLHKKQNCTIIFKAKKIIENKIPCFGMSIQAFY